MRGTHAGMDFTLQIQRVADVTIADVSGEFDIYSAPRFKEMFAAHIQQGDRSFVVNLESVRYLDSSGLAAVVALYKKSAASGATLRLVAPQPRTKRLLSISGVDRIIEIYNSRAEALAAAQAAPAGKRRDHENASV